MKNIKNELVSEVYVLEAITRKDNSFKGLGYFGALYKKEIIEIVLATAHTELPCFMAKKLLKLSLRPIDYKSPADAVSKLRDILDILRNEGK